MSSLQDSSLCAFQGSTDMYGFGIRLAFYLQWYGTVVASWLAPSEVPGLNLSNTVFISAIFLALVIQTASDSLRPLEIYIILLLCFGGYLYFVPLYAWKILIRCDPRWDPTRWSRVPVESHTNSVYNFLLMGAVSIYQLYFWFSLTPRSDEGKPGCPEYGVLLRKEELDNKTFITLNIVFQFLLLLCCLGFLCITAGKWMKIWVEREYERLPSAKQILGLLKIQSVIETVIATTVTVATELTIRWNFITGVHDLKSAGQLIPFVIGISLVLHVLYVFIKDPVESTRPGDRAPSGSDKNGLPIHGGGEGQQVPRDIDRFPRRAGIRVEVRSDSEE